MSEPPAHRSLSQLTSYERCPCEIDQENWVFIKNTGGMYEVSDHGRFSSNYTWKGVRGPRIIEGHISKIGYKVIQYKYGVDRKRTMAYAHTLVAKHFIGDQPPGQCLRHLDDNKADNHVANLCYGTYKENSEDAKRNGRIPIGVDRPNAILNPIKVRALRELRATGNYSYRNLAEIFDISIGGVRNVVSGRSWADPTT